MFGVVNTTVRGWANSKRTRSKAASRGKSKCSITSITAAASYPTKRLSRYPSDPWNKRSRSFCFSGNRSCWSRSCAIFSARCETSIPTISSNCFSANNLRRSFPSPHPKSRMRFAPHSLRASVTVAKRISFREIRSSNCSSSCA